MIKSPNEKVFIKLPTKVLSIFNEGFETELITELMKSKDLISFLSRYQRDRWIVESIDYIKKTENPGEFQIEYSISNFEACKDKYTEDADTIIVNYITNLESHGIEIIGEPLPEERSTLEEY